MRPALLAVLALLLLVAAPSASANSASDSYRLDGSGCTTSWSAGGYAARTGIGYLACGKTIRVVPPPGDDNAASTIPNPAYPAIRRAEDMEYDLAASPDGAFLYALYHNDIYPAPVAGGTEYRTARRMNRQPDGTYVLDPTWRLERFPYGGNWYVPDGISIAVDGFGDIYFANGLYPVVDTPSVILKYDAAGHYITHFGDSAPAARSLPESWTNGTFASAPTGVSVTRDGSKVYSGSYTDSRVQRFDRQANGTYRYALKWGNSYADDPQRQGMCVALRSPERPLARGELVRDPEAVMNEGKFGVAFDTHVDPWGGVIVNSTACKQLSAFTADGKWLYTLQYQDTGDVHAVAHSFAIDGQNNVRFGERAPYEAKLTSGLPAFPGPPVAPVDDTTAPMLSAFTMTPNGEVANRAIRVDISASDAVGVTQMRVANDANDAGQYVDFDAQPWVPYQASFTHQLRNSRDTQAVSVQVRDSAGNESRMLRQLIRFTGANGSPVVGDVVLPASSAVTNISVDVNARDDIAVTGVRFANGNEDIRGKAWVAWKTPGADGYARFSHVVTEGAGTKTVTVQVRDAAGNESIPLARSMEYRPNVLPPAIPVRDVLPVQPAARLVDTRAGVGAPQARVPAGGSITVQVTGRGGVPASGVDMVAVHLTAVSPAADGYATLYAAGAARPGTSNVNFGPGSVIANFALVKVGASGQVTLFNGGGASDFLLDLTGYVPAGSAITSVQPARLLDTRSGVGAPQARIAPNGSLTVQVAGRGGLPADAAFVAVNLTSVGASAPGYGTLHPTGAALPRATTVAYRTGPPRSNSAVLPLGASGQLTLTNVGGSSDYLLDVVGFARSGAGFTTLTPSRLIDTRVALGAPQARIAPGASINVQVAGRGGVPASGIGMVALNVTAVGTAGSGFTTLFPAGLDRPGTSNLNYANADEVQGFTLARVGANGQVTLYNGGGTTDYVVDVMGYVLA